MNINRDRLINGLVIVGILLVIGLVGASEQRMNTEQDISDMSAICAHSYQINSGDAEAACKDEITKVEADGRYEVISKDGKFWAESK